MERDGKGLKYLKYPENIFKKSGYGLIGMAMAVDCIE